VTTPVIETLVPASGLVDSFPWMSAIVVKPDDGRSGTPGAVPLPPPQAASKTGSIGRIRIRVILTLLLAHIEHQEFRFVRGVDPKGLLAFQGSTIAGRQCPAIDRDVTVNHLDEHLPIVAQFEC